MPLFELNKGIINLISLSLMILNSSVINDNTADYAFNV